MSVLLHSTFSFLQRNLKTCETRNKQKDNSRKFPRAKKSDNFKTSAPLFHGKVLTFARTSLKNEKCARIFCLILPISPEKRKTTSYCRVPLCLFISRILAKAVNFDSEV